MLFRSEGSVDPYNPKVVRATAGSLFRIPVVTRSLAEIASMGVQLVATSSHRGDAYTDTDLTVPIAVVLGNEAHGVPDDAPVHRWITIPHHGAAESLNVAMAATVLAFEVARQRRDRRPSGAAGPLPPRRAGRAPGPRRAPAAVPQRPVTC